MITKRIIKVPIYRYKIKIVVMDTLQEMKDLYPDLAPNTNGMVLEEQSCATIMVFPTSTSTIVHECEHLKNCIWNYVGQKVDTRNDEVDAYLIEYLFQQVMKVVEKHNSKKLLKT